LAILPRERPAVERGRIQGDRFDDDKRRFCAAPHRKRHFAVLMLASALLASFLWLRLLTSGRVFSPLLAARAARHRAGGAAGMGACVPISPGRSAGWGARRLAPAGRAAAPPASWRKLHVDSRRGTFSRSPR